MSEEELNNQITVDKPEKDPRRIEAERKLAAFNKMVRKRKETGDEPKELEHRDSGNNNNSEEEMSSTTKILLLAGAAGLGYYFYSTTNNSKEEAPRQQRQQPVTQNNNEVQENTVSKLRSFKN